MRIRNYQSGDEAAQAEIYNEAAAVLPRFKPARVEEVARRCRAAEFDPATRFYAEENGRVVGYAVFHPNGRVSYPWCRRGFETAAQPLFEAVVDALRQRRPPRAFAAYRGDWPEHEAFFLRNGFWRAREMINFVADVNDLDVDEADARTSVSQMDPEDVSAARSLAPQALRTTDTDALRFHLLANPYFPADSVTVLRENGNPQVRAVGVAVLNPAYADARAVDANMPCFRLGAFGTEGMQVKRLNGLFSFLARDDDEADQLGRILLGQTVERLRAASVQACAAQVPSDAAHLLPFYERHFRRQGSFPVLERTL